MSRYDCEQMRDLVPLLIRGQLLPHEAAATEQHLESCGDCREEMALVRAVAAAVPVVPGGLEARVVLAVRRPRPRSSWSPSRLAMAATLAAAVLGGRLVFDRWASPPTPEPNGGAIVFDDNFSPVMGWAVAQDPLLQSGSSLTLLSAEELELILAELDS
jgi:hypothetical protein